MKLPLKLIPYCNKIFFFLFIQSSLFSLESKLNNGYKDIKLGMKMEEVKKIINTMTDFSPLKEEVLVVRTEPDTQIITTEGLGFIEMAYFHFHDDVLFQILLKLSEKKIGYYTLLKSLIEKYGPPLSLTPNKAYWTDDVTKIVIEKPCTIKYQYLPIWNNLTKKEEKEIITKTIREEFLKNF